MDSGQVKRANTLLLLSHKLVSDSLGPHGLQPARLLCPWNFSGKSTEGGPKALTPASASRFFITEPCGKPEQLQTKMVLM